MAHTIFRSLIYKGSTIEQVETFNQRFFVINGNYAEAVWSISDAKSIINGLQPNSYPVSICKEDLI